MIVIVSQLGLERYIPGNFGVTIFFFLSRYLITTLMRMEKEKTDTTIEQEADSMGRSDQLFSLSGPSHFDRSGASVCGRLEMVSEGSGFCRFHCDCDRHLLWCGNSVGTVAEAAQRFLPGVTLCLIMV